MISSVRLQTSVGSAVDLSSWCIVVLARKGAICSVPAVPAAATGSSVPIAKFAKTRRSCPERPSQSQATREHTVARVIEIVKFAHAHTVNSGQFLDHHT